MADIKKYYYLKLKDNFFDSEEIKVLESSPNGIYYSNLLMKLYLKSLKFNGALRFNEYIPYDENMIATITGLNIDIVRSGLFALASLKLIERLDDGTIYMLNIQSFIGKSNSEADRKRLYREKIEEQKLLLGQMSDICPTEDEAGIKADWDKCPEASGTFKDKHPPEIEKEIELKTEKEIEIKTKRKSETYSELATDKDINKIHSQSVNLLYNFEKETGLLGRLNLEDLKKVVRYHGVENVKTAINIALERDKATMIYIKGILKNWAKEGYPKEGEENGIRGTGKDTGAGANEFSGFKPREPRVLTEEERAALENELL
jgi:predicted phage replisome organizer